MKEYIVSQEYIDGIYTDEGSTFGLDMQKELIRCKDCKYNPENAMLYPDDDLIEGYIHCGHLGDKGFCSLGKGKAK